SEKRQVHRVVVFVSCAVLRHVHRLEGALIEMSRDTEAEAMRHRIDGATLAFVEREQSLPKQQRRAACGRASRCNRAVRATRNRWSLTLKKLSSQTVGCRRPHKSFRDVHRVVGSCLVEFG